MKKILLISLLILALAGLSGCATDVSDRLVTQEDAVLTQSNRPDRTQDLIGKIEEVRGNKVEILEVKLPEGALGQLGESGQSSQGLGDGADRRDQLSKMTEEERQQFMQEMRAQKEAQGQSGQAGFQQRNAGAKQFTYEETGNSYKVLIPVGTPLIKRSMATSGLQQTNMQISEVKEGDMFRIWVEKLETEGESTVIYAELLSPRT